MTIATDLQSLEPGAIWAGYVFDGSNIGAGVLRFHSDNIGVPVFWQGAEYTPRRVEATGFAITTDKPPTPRIKVANTDRVLTVLCAFFDDLIGAKLYRKRTLVKFMDAVNFPGGNPTADPGEHFDDELWIVERKVEENPEYVEFELSSALNFAGVRLPRRQMVQGCPAAEIYRTSRCGYAGPPVAEADGTPTTDPLLDRCGGRLSDCRLRWGANAQLPHNGFPAISMTRM